MLAADLLGSARASRVLFGAFAENYKRSLIKLKMALVHFCLRSLKSGSAFPFVQFYRLERVHMLKTGQ
jgi:hypothetical protein